MNSQRLKKQTVFAETLPIKELLEETLARLQRVPKATVASRRLAVIIGHLDSWQKQYMPDLNAALDKPDDNPYSRVQVDETLAAYRDKGFFGLTDEQKQILDWFDNNYVKQRPGDSAT